MARLSCLSGYWRKRTMSDITRWLDTYTTQVSPQTKKQLDYYVGSNHLIFPASSKYQVGAFAKAIGCDAAELHSELSRRGHKFITAKTARVYGTRITTQYEYDTVTTLRFRHPTEAGVSWIGQDCLDCGVRIFTAVHGRWYSCQECGLKWSTNPKTKWRRNNE